MRIRTHSVYEEKMASLFTPLCKPEDAFIASKWRNLLRLDSHNKRIPEALVPLYCNEKVQLWIQNCGEIVDLLDQEARYLSRIFSPLNWESLAIHPSKLACLLCVNIDSHSYESAMFRVSDPDFFRSFIWSHYKDRLGDKSEERAFLKSLYESSEYTGRPLKTLFFLFLRDNPGFAFQFAFQIQEYENLM